MTPLEDGSPTRLEIRPAGQAGVSTMLAWAAAEGWNPGIDDATAFHRADPGGFLIGALDEEPVASVSLVRYDASFAFLGLYIVRPEWRRSSQSPCIGRLLACPWTIGAGACACDSVRIR